MENARVAELQERLEGQGVYGIDENTCRGYLLLGGNDVIQAINLFYQTGGGSYRHG